jgi:hypothetical protein
MSRIIFIHTSFVDIIHDSIPNGVEVEVDFVAPSVIECEDRFGVVLVQEG